jgi:hypothetical protein
LVLVPLLEPGLSLQIWLCFAVPADLVLGFGSSSGFGTRFQSGFQSGFDYIFSFGTQSVYPVLGFDSFSGSETLFQSQDLVAGFISGFGSGIQFHGRMARGGNRLPKVSTAPANRVS